MIRILLAAIVLLAGAPAHAQGTLPVALAQQVDQNGRPLAGALLYVYTVGTVAQPQTAFQDTGLTLPLPWPVQADQNGRLPMFYLASGSVHVRLTDAAGGVQFDIPQMLVIGPAGGGGGGGGGGTVDPTAISSTGDIKFRVTNEVLTGWVMLNGQTIGSATSGASGRANADTQSLFIYLWQNCTNAHCPVSSGRGASGLADFQANKTIGLPDLRGRYALGRDCMLSACSGRIVNSNVTSGGGDTADTPLASGGSNTSTIAVGNLPTINSTVSVTIAAGQGSHTHALTNGTNVISTANGAGIVNPAGANSNPTTIANATLPQMSGTGTATFTGTDTPLPVLDPFVMGTWYMRL